MNSRWPLRKHICHRFPIWNHTAHRCSSVPVLVLLLSLATLWQNRLSWSIGCQHKYVHRRIVLPVLVVVVVMPNWSELSSWTLNRPRFFSVSLKVVISSKVLFCLQPLCVYLFNNISNKKTHYLKRADPKARPLSIMLDICFIIVGKQANLVL